MVAGRSDLHLGIRIGLTKSRSTNENVRVEPFYDTRGKNGLSSQTTASAAAYSGGGNGAMIHPSNDSSPVGSSATTVAVAGIPTDDPKQNLTQVINSIQKTLGILHQLYLTVSSFNVASQLPLLQRMSNLVLELDNMTRLAKNCNIQALRRHLLEELDQAFPDEVETYREIRASSASESERLEQALRSLPNGDVKVKAET
ncbi:mediator of RNA polymerase II transcription subunit 10b-like [Primulina tabacum]|uniref:mediator of RNA polymerase II transcription subunit 10b-like n=1 Tax=Primulina tabacum TaxID=48773 RepID=UPI003F59EFE4